MRFYADFTILGCRSTVGFEIDLGRPNIYLTNACIIITSTGASKATSSSILSSVELDSNIVVIVLLRLDLFLAFNRDELSL